MWDCGHLMAKNLADEVTTLWTTNLFLYYLYRKQIRQLGWLKQKMVESKSEGDVIAVLTCIAQNTRKWQAVFNAARRRTGPLLAFVRKSGTRLG